MSELKEKISNLILSYLQNKNNPLLSPSELYDLLNDGTFEIKDFWRTVSELEEKYELTFTKKGKLILSADAGIYKGTYSASSRGNFGFVTTEEGEFFIPPRLTGGAIYSDTVAIKRLERGAKYYGKGNEAEVLSVISRGLTTVVGDVYVRKYGKVRLAEVVPENEKIHLSISVSLKSDISIKSGDRVLCKITSFPKLPGENARGEIIENLGDADSKSAGYRAILIEHGIRTEFDSDTLSEAISVASEKISAVGRLDLRDRCIFTIDSDSAKDLDDAISVEVTENGYVLGVHIADVSHYVRENSFLEKEAFLRGTSVYFTDKVVPMLPKELSNGICSLNPNEDRLTLSAFVSLDKDGAILSCDIQKSIIRSRIKGIYAELNDIINNKEESEFYNKYAELLPDFDNMLTLYEVLSKRSRRRGAMELEGEEAKIILDENGDPVKIVKEERGVSERLIEQFMLCANEAVASYLYDAGMPCVYRVHESPDPEKIDAFTFFARNLGIDVSPLRTKNTITSSQLQAVLDNSKKTGHFSIVSSVLLRSLMKAKYSSVQKPHFGLATEYYCHFTSPIRRFPDLCVHRILKALLSGKITEDTYEKYENMASLCANASTEADERAVYAERDIEDLYKCIYMSGREGETLSGVISSVTSFGFFVKTDELCEGLVHIDTLGGGFVYDKATHQLARGKIKYTLGMKVTVLVDSVDVGLRQINFKLKNKK